jgi:hypothetical protein
MVQWFSNMMILQAREDAEIHLHALQSMTEQFQLCERGHCRLGKLHRCLEIMSGTGMHLITQPVHVLPFSNSAVKGNNGTNRTLYRDIAAKTITELMFHCWNQTFGIVGFLVCSPNVKSS